MSPPAKMVGMDDCMLSLTAIVPSGLIPILDGAWDNRVGRYTYADDGKVDVDGFRGSGDGYGTAASAGIRFTSSIF